MDNEVLVEEACRIHMEHSREFYRVTEAFVNRGENRVLLWLSSQNNPCAVDIVNHFGLSTGRVSNILKALEKKNFIFRQQDTIDHRKSYIRLRPEGAKQAQQICDDMHAAYRTFFRVMGEEDAQAFLAFERKVLRMIDNGALNIVASPEQ